MTRSVGSRWTTIVAVVAAVLAMPWAATSLWGQQDTALALTAVRFYRAPESETLVDVFCRIPLARLGAARGSRQATYRVAVSVRDSGGLELLDRSWSHTVGAPLLRLEGVTSTEHFQFAARAGRYVVEVVVTDSASGHVSRQRAVVSAYAEPPEASDLLVASTLRQGAGGDTTLRLGELRKGSVFLETSGRPLASPDRAGLGYYLELYAQWPETASVAARVLDAAGKQLRGTSAQPIAVPAGGGAATAMLDLSGLPPGDYQLELLVATRDSHVVREGSFGMAGFGRAVAAPAEFGSEEAMGSDTLVRLSEAQLDAMYAPLVYLLDPEERGVYPGLTADGKRAFLRHFWAKRDPTPGTPRNEFEEVFYQTVAEASSRFREGGSAAVPGWRTDRGRIYILYGPPDDMFERPQGGSAKPYEVWKYTKKKSRRFIFLDRTSMGNYELIWTDERREPSRPDWQALLGPEALADAMRF